MVKLFLDAVSVGVLLQVLFYIFVSSLFSALVMFAKVICLILSVLHWLYAYFRAINHVPNFYLDQLLVEFQFVAFQTNFSKLSSSLNVMVHFMPDIKIVASA